jgi:hypothetical protein
MHARRHNTKDELVKKDAKNNKKNNNTTTNNNNLGYKTSEHALA